jgi:hypothetical protein
VVIGKYSPSFGHEIARPFLRTDGHREERNVVFFEHRQNITPELYGQLPAEKSPERAHEVHHGGFFGAR